MKKNCWPTLACAIVGLAFAHDATAATITWTGGAGTNSWHTAANWDLNRVPGVGDDVVIPDMTPNVTVTHSTGSTSINSLTSEEAFTLSVSTLTIDAASNLNSSFSLSNSTLSGSGVVTVHGAMTWTGSSTMSGTGKTIIAPSGSLAISDNAQKTLSRTLENHSPNATWTAPSSTTFVFNNGTLFNAADGTFTANLTANNTQYFFSSTGGTNAVINEGTFNKIGGGILILNSLSTGVPLNNSGTFNVDVGALTLLGGGSNTGTIDADPGTTLTFQTQSYTFDPASSLTGSGTLTFNSPTYTLACTLSTNRTINVAGTVNFNAPYTFSGTLNLTGSLSGSADITVTGAMNWTSSGTMSGTGKTIIAPSGSLAISDNAQKTLSRTLENHSPNATWTAPSSTTFVFNNGTLFNAADGTFTANLTANNTQYFFSSTGGTNAVINEGNFVKTGNGILVFSASTAPLPFTNSGAIRVLTNRLSLATLTNLSGTTLTGGTYDVTGTLQFTGANIVDNAANIILDGAASAIQNTSGVNALSNFATNTSSGQFQIKNGRTFARSGSFSNAGLVTIGPGDNTLNIDTIINTGTITKPGAGTGNINSAVACTNSGTMEVPSGILIVTPLSNQSGTTLTGGTYNVAGILRYTAASVGTNAASIILDGPSSAIQDTAGANALGNIVSNTAAGSLQIKNGRNLALPGTFTNLGQVRIGPGASTLSDTGNYMQTSGATTLEGGTLAPTDLADFVGGELKGSGAILGNVRNSGVCKPGLSGGAISISGNYTQTVTGLYEAEIGGPAAGTDYDQLSVAGTALLSGSLRVLMINGFAPAIDDTFDILTANLAIVKLATIQLPFLPSLRGMQIEDGFEGLRLEVIDCGPGDANGDGVGDACETAPDLTWNTVAGGGATFSSGGIFRLGATIGQPIAGSPEAPLTGGIFTLVAGFWAGIDEPVVPACPLLGDMNNDGLRNGVDIQKFVDCLLGSNDPACSCADVNESGEVDLADLVAFAQILIS